MGLDFHGVKTVSFGYGNGTYTSVPIATNGLFIDANGTTLTFNNATLQGIVGGDWTDSNGSYNRDIRLTTAADQNVDTSAIAIRTEAPPTITSHDAGAHYRRDTVVVISGSNLGTATRVDLVDAAGALISGVNPITGADLNATQGVGNAWTIRLAANLLDADGNETDTIGS